ncbi:MAG: hypothetical protein ABSD89_05690 [Halobacteriota archaeon]|jgi:hypothetical protein
MPSYHFERALFVVGEPNSGKSNQLRSMFRDVRLGTGGDIPTQRRLLELYRLSNERCLYLRLTSPHEAGESIGRKRHGRKNFLTKTGEIIEENTPRMGKRWNFAGALQANARNNMPDVVKTCRAFVRYFEPERTRVVFLSPDRHGRSLQETEHMVLVDRLREISSVEVSWIDARNRTVNGLLLADFFDFI